jgi:addiction module RelE/StbE family toxin
MYEAQFESRFLKDLQKHTSIKKAIQNKVDMILQNPFGFGKPLQGNWQGFYSCHVKRNFVIIYLCCDACRKKEDDQIVLCSDCQNSPGNTVKFILFAPHDEAYSK